MTVSPVHRRSIEDSLAAGIAAMRSSQPAVALKWLSRATRLAPNSPVASFMFAVALTRTDPASAVTRFATLIDEWPDFRDAHFAIADAILRVSGAEAAALALATALTRFNLPPHADLQRLAVDISRAAGVPGWIGLGGDSVLTLSITAWQAPAQLDVRVGGTTLHRQVLAAGPLRRIRLRLPESIARDAPVVAMLDGEALLGSGLLPAIVLRIEALVLPPAKGMVRGHAWMPGTPETPPCLIVRTNGVPDAMLRVPGRPKLAGGHPLAGLRAFAFPLPIDGPVHVLGPDGRDVAGSPVFPNPMPPPRLPPPCPGLDIIIPVIRGATDLRNCLASLRPSLAPGTRVVVVDDGSADRALLSLLRRCAAAGDIIVLRHVRTRGYPAAVNTGLCHAAGHDVVLLNPDTLLPKDCIVRLAAAAYAAPDIGSATPLSNEASIVSYPNANGGNPVPKGAALNRLDRLCQTVNRGRQVDLPTAVGFCMYVRADCLAASGGFREDVFAQGYGEENEWCRRSASLGWRHVAATDVFVSHLGGRSFGSLRTGLMARNGAVLNRLHPGYDALVQRFVRQDPLAEARRGLDMARWQHAGAGPLVLLVSHNLGGGVTRFVQDRCEALHAAGRRTLVVRPGDDRTTVLEADSGLACPNLRFRLPAEWAVLLSWLKRQNVERVELQHYLNHVPGVELLARRLGVPLDIYVHDNIFFCPRLTLVGRSGRYCGEPVDPAVCDSCVAELGSSIPNPPPVATLRAQSCDLFATANQVIVPCEDVARRVRRYTRTIPVVRPWQDDGALPPRRAVPRGALRVAVLGALNQDKGLEVLCDCARLARSRQVPIEFVLVGFSADDDALIAAGVFVTGRFAPDEAASLLRRENPGIGFVPSVVPETWCYALTTMWEAGLDVLSFDLGAQAERTRATGRGRVLPLGVPAALVLKTLLAMQSARME